MNKLGDIKFNIVFDGRGIWYMLHVLAINATDDKLKEAFVITVESLCANFGCDHCQKHFRKFIDDNPFKDYWFETYGFFRWTWELHNDINIKINKQIMEYDVAYNQYKSSVCVNCEKTKYNKILIPTNKLISSKKSINIITRY